MILFPAPGDPALHTLQHAKDKVNQLRVCSVPLYIYFLPTKRIILLLPYHPALYIILHILAHSINVDKHFPSLYFLIFAA